MNFNKIKNIVFLNALLLIQFNLAASHIDTVFDVRAFEGRSITFRTALGDRFLTVKGGKSERKTGFNISKNTGGFAQTFRLERAEDGYYFLKAECGGYMHVWQANPNAKASVMIWDKADVENLKWKFEKAGNGFYYIKSKLGNYLDVQWGNSDHGTPVWMYTFNGGPAQKWKIEVFNDRGMTDFNPKTHGFKFSNQFKNGLFRNGPDVFEFGGLCGGMVYTTLDYFHHGIQIPRTSELPKKKSLLESYIYDRQQKSFLPNIDKWTELTFNPFGSRDREFFFWGLEGRLATLKMKIDSNEPVPLGLYTTGNGFKGHHQVLAIGYDLSGYRFKKDKDKHKHDVRIFIYDPNYPGEIIILRAGLNNTWTYHFTSDDKNLSTGKEFKKWRTYFIDDKYSKRRPPIN